MIKRLLFLLLLSLSTASYAEAACSGSGITWSCTAGSSKANVNTAIGSGTTGMTLTMANGSYTWTTGDINWDPAKSIAIICESVGGCDASLGSTHIIYNDDVNGATTEGSQKTWRISGFDFTGACAAPCNWVYPRTGQPTQYLTLHVDHNTFTNQADGTEFFTMGEGSRDMKFKGVFNNNTWTNTTQTRIVIYGTGDPEQWTGSLLGQEGPETGKCVFFEDNTINFASTDGGSGFIDAENTSCYVFRFNTVTDTRVLQHGVTHGWGTSNFEVYGNSFTRTSNADGLGNCFRSVHMQGSGTGAFWGNTFSCFSSISGSTIEIIHYRDATLAVHGSGGTEQCDGTQGVDGNTAPTGTHRGYPCYHQPGRAPGGNDMWPIPVFLNSNVSGGAKVDASYYCGWGGTPYCTQHVQADRDYFNAVSKDAQTTSSSPFDGTTGIGHGTLARRPSTCTHNTAPDGDNGGGVMYWATDQGSWNSSSSNGGVNRSGADGVLYRCSSTDNWSVYYTPYAYPHELRDDAGDPGGGGTAVGKGGKGRARIRG